MKKIFYFISWVVALQIMLFACRKDEAGLGTPPTAADAVFTFAPSAANANIIEFTSTGTAFLKKWDFGNSTKAQGDQATGTYPLKGTYTVTLTVFTSGGSASSSQTVEIAETDPTLLDIPVYNMLTGGRDAVAGKTWVVDAFTAGHFGVGPPATLTPDYYKAGVNEKAGAGLYDDKYIFKLEGFSYTQQTNGDVFVNAQQAGNFPGAFPNSGDDTAPFNAPTGLTWTVTTDDAGAQFLAISTGGFIGYYTGTNTYQILTVTEDQIMLRYLDAANDGLAWYLRLVPDGFTPPPPAAATLPIDFEGAAVPFVGFVGAAFDQVANPDATGLNTSAKVGKYDKGTQATYAGMSVNLASKLDLSANFVIKYNVYSPVTGTAVVKLESIDGTATTTQVSASIPAVNQWVDLSFDFTGAANNTFDKITVFLDFDNNNGGVFYFDNIRQTATTSVLTEEALTGGGSKSWVLKPAVGAFGVGPAKGSDQYYPNGGDLSGDRPCLFNDEFIFKTAGVYTYDSKGDLFGESYMGYPDGQCRLESTLPVPAASWGSGDHTWTFTAATDTDPAYITVTGTGAFIALPKAHNGGEYAAAPPDTDASVKYEVISYVKNGSSETLAITVDIGGGTFWSFVLIPK